MNYFDDLAFYRFNHLVDHHETVDRTFHTHCLNYLPDGRIHWRFDREKETFLKGPCAYWSWPGPRWRYWQVEGEPWEHYFVSFTGPRIQRWRRQGLFVAKRTPPPVLAITNPTRFRESFEALIALLSQAPVKNPEAVNVLEGLLLQLHNQPPEEAVFHPRRSDVMALVNRIEREPERDYDFDEEAEALAMTVTHMRRLFRLFTGESPVGFVNRARLNRAAFLLRTTDRAVKQVADDLGFSDVYYFTKLFSRQHRQPPAAYRRSYQTIA